MGAFATAINSLFADHNVAIGAFWRAGGTGPVLPVRVIRCNPDAVVSFGDGRVVVASERVLVPVSSVSSLEPGDTLEIDGVVFEVIGQPVRDAQRLYWTAELKPA
jgi:glyoxylase-like metal-dependent hydrolase (beta-lactamase superfamily II)